MGKGVFGRGLAADAGRAGKGRAGMGGGVRESKGGAGMGGECGEVRGLGLMVMVGRGGGFCRRWEAR